MPARPARRHTGARHGHRVPRRAACTTTAKAAAAPGARIAEHGGAQRPHHHGNGGPALPTRRRAESSRLLCWLQHATETGTASSGARGGHRCTQQRRPGGDSDRTEVQGAEHSGPTAATAVSRSDTQRPGERRTADRTGNGGTNKAAHRDPDRQQKQRTSGDSLDQTPSWKGLEKPVASVATCVLERQSLAANGSQQ